MRKELAEEVRKRDQEAEEKRQRRLEEAMRKRKGEVVSVSWSVGGVIFRATLF